MMLSYNVEVKYNYVQTAVKIQEISYLTLCNSEGVAPCMCKFEM